MVISLDLTPELVAALDKRQVKRPEPPVWPFPKRQVKFSRLSLKEQKKLKEFQDAMRVYNDYPTIIKPARGSRSAVVEELLRAALNLPEPVKRERKKRDPKPKAETVKRQTFTGVDDTKPRENTNYGEVSSGTN